MIALDPNLDKPKVYDQNFLINYSTLDGNQDKLIQNGSFVQWQGMEEEEDAESPDFFGKSMAGYNNYYKFSQDYQQDAQNEKNSIKLKQIRDNRIQTEPSNQRNDTFDKFMNFAQTNTLKKLGSLFENIDNINNSNNPSKGTSKQESRSNKLTSRQNENEQLELKKETSNKGEHRDSFASSEKIRLKNVINLQKKENQYQINKYYQNTNKNKNQQQISQKLTMKMQPNNENNPTQIQKESLSPPKLLNVLNKKRIQEVQRQKSTEQKQNLNQSTLNEYKFNIKNAGSSKYVNRTFLRHIEYPIHLTYANEQNNLIGDNNNHSFNKLSESTVSIGSNGSNQAYQTRYQQYRNEILEKNRLKNTTFSNKTAFNICEQYLLKRENLLSSKMPQINQQSLALNASQNQIRNRSNSFFEEKIYNFIQNYQKKHENRYFEILSLLYEKYSSETNSKQKLKYKQNIMQYYNILKKQNDKMPHNQSTNRLTPGEKELSSQMNEHLQRILSEEKYKESAIKRNQSQQILKLNFINQLPSLTYHQKSDLNCSLIQTKPKKRVLIASQSSPEKKFRSISEYLQPSESEESLNPILTSNISSQQHYFAKSKLSRDSSYKQIELVHKSPRSQSNEKQNYDNQILIANSYKHHLNERKNIPKIRVPLNFLKNKQQQIKDGKPIKEDNSNSMMRITSQVFAQIKQKVQQDSSSKCIINQQIN